MNEENLRRIIENCFVRLKKKFYEKYTIEKYEDDTSLHILEKRDLVESLPPPSMKIIEIINDSIESKHKKGLLIKYDYSPQVNTEIKFYGSVLVSDTMLVQKVSKKFDFDENEIERVIDYTCKDFTGSTTWEPTEGWSMQFIAGDIENEPELFYEDWERGVLWDTYGIPVLSEKFRRTRFDDFSKLYSLEDDPIQSFFEVTEPAPQFEYFTMDFKSIQKSIAPIQLIPQVPKAVKTTIQRAKKLYLYGYFEYHFFTISMHYSYLALESAIKLRYVQSLNGVAILSLPNQNFKLQMNNPTHYRIVEVFNNNRKKGWLISDLLVNGEKFPYGGNKLLDWLEEKHLIRKWEKSIFKAGIDLRNSMSHLETAETMMPSAKLLQVIVNEINYIFHQEIPNVNHN